MKASFQYQIQKPYQNFSTRLLRFVANRFYLYIPDLVLIVLLVIPPYHMEKILLIVSGLVILGFRDIVLMRRSIYYLKQFSVDDHNVKFSVIKYSDVAKEHENHIANVALEKAFNPFRLIIRENDEVVHQQYALGYWNKSRLEDLHDKYNNLKQDVTLESMFKAR
jgi:hypothetical protein